MKKYIIYFITITCPIWILFYIVIRTICEIPENIRNIINEILNKK
jgi:hypothetical protein